MFGRLQVFRGALTRPVMSALEFVNSAGIDIETDDRELAAQVHRERQPDIAEPDNGDLDLVEAGCVCHGFAAIVR